MQVYVLPGYVLSEFHHTYIILLQLNHLTDWSQKYQLALTPVTRMFRYHYQYGFLQSNQFIVESFSMR